MTNLATYHSANLPELMKVIRQNGIGMDDYLDRFFNAPPQFYNPQNEGREKFLKERLEKLWKDRY